MVVRRLRGLEVRRISGVVEVWWWWWWREERERDKEEAIFVSFLYLGGERETLREKKI